MFITSVKIRNFRAAELVGKNLDEIASILYGRLATMQTQLERISEAEWKEQFLDACNTERNLLEEIWDATWQENCDGKKLFVDLQKRLEINMPLLRFKKAVIREMKNASTETWRSMESLLRELLKSPTQTSGEQIGAPQLIPVP